MEQFDLLQYVVQAADQLSLRYFITGSTATIYYGEPRFTNDIDVVIDLSDKQVDSFCELFPYPDFYVSQQAVREAIFRRSQFNVIHPASGMKVDFMIPGSSAFNRSRFERARPMEIGNNHQGLFASPEDAIIKKMEYYRLGGSEKHLRDITGVLRSGKGQIDHAYITHWANQMGLTEVWAAIQNKLTSP